MLLRLNLVIGVALLLVLGLAVATRCFDAIIACNDPDDSWGCAIALSEFTQLVALAAVVAALLFFITRSGKRNPKIHRD